MWIPLSIVTALGFAASNSHAKALARSSHVYTVTWAMMTLALPWALIALWWSGMPAVQEGFLLAALGSVVLNMVAVTLQVRALSIAPLSVTVPFLGLTPLFMLLTSAVILGEAPNPKGVAGIVLVSVGAYTIYLDRIHGGLLAPLRAIGTEKGPRLMLLTAFIWSWAATLDKLAVLKSSPAYYTTFFSIAFGVLYLPLLVRGLRERPSTGSAIPRLFLLGGLSAAMILAQMFAIELTLVSYVIAIKRAGAVVAVLFGSIFFKEEHLRTRLLGAVLMTAGVVLILL
jgi:drug/metabolite transporter (DMT)-like permease